MFSSLYGLISSKQICCFFPWLSDHIITYKINLVELFKNSTSLMQVSSSWLKGLFPNWINSTIYYSLPSSPNTKKGNFLMISEGVINMYNQAKAGR